MIAPYKFIARAGILAAAFSSFSLAASAQEAAAPTEAPAPLTAETAQVGQMYLAEAADPWELRCTKVETGEPPCQMFQLLRDETGGEVAEFNMFKIPEGNEAAAGAVVVVPLETMLSDGLVITVDENEPRAYPFAFCNSYGCISRVGLTVEELEWFKAGNEAILTIVPAVAPDQQVNLTLSLKGFSAMLDKTRPAQ